MDATVLCHQLGFGNAIRADGGASFGQGVGDIAIDNMRCVGNEVALQECPSDVGVDESCDHGQDAGAVCGVAAASSNIRLVGGFTSNEGRVELFHDGTWGTICDSGWDIADAQVACRQLGYTGAMSLKINAFFGQGNGAVLLANLGCTGDETGLIRCTHPGWNDVPSYCTHARDAGVTCRVSTSDGYLNVRLVNSNNAYNTNEGRVEVYHHGSWGTVCGLTFDLNAASVVCRQLGFQGALATRNFAYYGEGNEGIHLSNIVCTGNEADLGNCQHAEGNTGGCTHADDAGVVCIGSATASLSITSLELIISAAIFVLLMSMVLALIFTCYRCRKSSRAYSDDHDRHHDGTHNSADEELELSAIQMRRLRGRQPSIPNTYAPTSFRRSGGSAGSLGMHGGMCAPSSPYESHLFTQGGAIGGVTYDYESMDFKKCSLPSQPPPYTSPCSTPVCDRGALEFPCPPSPRASPSSTLPRFPSQPSPRASPSLTLPTSPKPSAPLPILPKPTRNPTSADASADTDAAEDGDVYQDIDDYLVPESPATDTKEEH